MNLHHYIKNVIKDELTAIKDQFIESKFIFLAFVICLVGILTYLQPFPDRHIHIATSYPNSDWYQAGEFASEYLNEKGLDSTVVATDGAVDNVNQLIDPNNPINAAFTYGIALNDKQRSEIVSLGSLSYEPIWIFYRKDRITQLRGLNDLASYRVGLGPTDSGSYAISKILMSIYGIDIHDDRHFFPNAFLNTERNLLDGKLDAMVLVSTVRDPIIQKLMRTPGIELFNFSNADGFQKNFNSFESVRLPAGSLSIYPQIPAHDVSLVATTTSMVVKKNMHPDLQLALLMAAKEANRNSTSLFFAQRNEFPAYMDPLVPISPVASKFYDYGPPQVMRHLPFWIAGFIDRAWLLLLTLFAVFYPLSKLNLHIRKLRFIVHERPHYEELLEIDALLSKKKLTEEEKLHLTQRLDHINAAACNAGVPIGEETHYFELLNSIYLLRRKIEIN